jgi:ABC-type lipoprotein release transport system permease subunit
MIQLIKLAWRSIWRNRRRTIITLSSIALSLVLAVFFIAMSDGMYGKLINDAVRMQAGHMTVENVEYRDAPAIDLVVANASGLRKRIEEIPGVEKTKLLVFGQGVAKSGNGSIGVAIMGIEPEIEVESSPLARKIIAGEYLQKKDKRKAVIGSQLAKRLKLEVGKKMVVSSNNVAGELVEELVRIKGIYETSSVEIDSYFVQLPLGFSKKVFGMHADDVTQLGVIVHDYNQRDEIMEDIEKVLSEFSGLAVHSWEKIMPDLAAFMAIDEGSNYIFQGIIIFLMMFTIFNTILMSVLERRREFAVLLALGTPPARIKLQVLIESAFLALLGCFFGLLIGGLLAHWAAIEGIDVTSMLEEGFSVSGFAVDPILRPMVTTRLLMILGLVVFVATLIMSLYPMGRIKRIPVADVLR